MFKTFQNIKLFCLKQFKTLDLSHKYFLTLNDLRTEFTAVSEGTKQVRWLSQLRVDFLFRCARKPRVLKIRSKPAELGIRTRSASEIFLVSFANIPKITCNFRNLKIPSTEIKTIEQNEGFRYVQNSVQNMIKTRSKHVLNTF